MLKLASLLASSATILLMFQSSLVYGDSKVDLSISLLQPEHMKMNLINRLSHVRQKRKSKKEEEEVVQEEEEDDVE